MEEPKLLDVSVTIIIKGKRKDLPSMKELYEAIHLHPENWAEYELLVTKIEADFKWVGVPE